VLANLSAKFKGNKQFAVTSVPKFASPTFHHKLSRRKDFAIYERGAAGPQVECEDTAAT